MGVYKEPVPRTRTIQHHHLIPDLEIGYPPDPMVPVNHLPPIVYAVMANDEQLVRARIAAGLDINHVDPVRSTALSAATARGNVSLIRLLLEHGADPRIKDTNGKDTFDYIRHYDCLDALGVLGDPRFAWIKPVKPTPTRLPDFTGPQDFDPHGGAYEPRSCVITGLTCHNSGGAWSDKEDHEVSINQVIAWRDDHGVIHLNTLLLLKPTLPSARFVLPEQGIFRLTVQMNKARTRAVVMGDQHTAVEDADLSRFLIEYLTPQIIPHPILGPLRLDRRFGGYDGEIIFAGQSTTIRLDDISEATLAAAVGLLDNSEALVAKLRQLFETEAFKLWKDSWAEDGDEVMTLENARSLAVPFGIDISADGKCIKFSHGGDDWFAGHGVTITHDREAGLWHVNLVG